MENKKEYCLILGVDLTGRETPKFKRWFKAVDGEKRTLSYDNSNVELFIDYDGKKEVYLGCVIAEFQDETFEKAKFDISEIKHQVYDDLLDKLTDLVSQKYFTSSSDNDGVELGPLKIECILFVK